VRADLESRGIRFYGLSTALARIPDSLRTYLASVIPPDDDPIAALNAALWTEGSFLYVPPGVSVGIPLQAEIRDDYSKVEAFARKGQHQDVGAEMVHLAPRTHSRIVNHGIVQKGGRATLRSGIRVAAGATEVTSSVTWSSLMLDAESRAQTSPSIEVDEADAEIVQEGTVRKVGEEMLFYMSS